ncbi:Radical SAM domain protein [Nitrospina gracilis 3/211]|uniref:Radical SAM domain protein n=1 Tax=Nitrospina gracilis (strain 3/211) TaxID=1266370 RepID=M1YIL9_NITG3|nr:radical SAM protein [Nitrospina gracilis]MCF8723288.1 putative pyruvate formate lyase activating enzyme [Nitrospina sp. Nb-3]CCQ90338.1 Radical SAM domain protein [Nitrospina gracilis 3/211]
MSTPFTINSEKFEPAYMKLHRTGELFRRSREALRALTNCRVCPRDCEVDRLNNEFALCKTGRYAYVSSFFPHFGEEDCLRGWNGSGTIFFSMCNLKCVFCQNYDISQKHDGDEVGPEALAQIMLRLQAMGCHNINFVTPEHVVPQILEALPMAVEMGLRLPLVYNTGAYDSLESIESLCDIVDIFMPDFKYWEEKESSTYLKAKSYPDAARAAIKAMHEQVGDLVFDEKGLARRGVLVRHLVMPNSAENVRPIMRWLANEISPDTYVNIMDQYRPAGKVTENRFREICRRTTSEEHAEAVRIAKEEGLRRFDTRDPEAFLAYALP